MDINTYGQNPGMFALVQTNEAAIWNGREIRNEYAMIPLSSAAVDSGNTPTTTLRPGLLLGKITSSGLAKAYDPTSTDGSQVAYAPLLVGDTTLDSSGAVSQKNVHVLIRGVLRASALVNLDNMARKQLLMSGRYVFDDDLLSPHVAGGPHLSEVTKAADYTVVASDAGTLFTASAAANFTLPALAAGLGPFEFLNLADSNMTVTSAAGDDIVWDNDAAVDSLAFSTASHKIGGRLQFRCNAAGTKWLVRNYSPAGCTVTAAT